MALPSLIQSAPISDLDLFVGREGALGIAEGSAPPAIPSLQSRIKISNQGLVAKGAPSPAQFKDGAMAAKAKDYIVYTGAIVPKTFVEVKLPVTVGGFVRILRMGYQLQTSDDTLAKVAI